MNIAISVIIPTYNRVAKVQRSIESTLPYLNDNIFNEIIIIDDDSSDQTYEIISKKYIEYIENGKVKIFKCATNKGVTAARNKGVEISSSEWILFLDSDDYLISNAEQILLDAIKLNQHHDLILFRSADIVTNETIGLHTPPHELTFNMLYNKGTPGECLLLIKKMVMLKFPYREKLRGSEGITYLEMLYSGHTMYLTDMSIRIYDRTGDDRLCTKSSIRKRSYELFIYNLLLTRYINHASPKKILEIFSRLFMYGMYSVISRLK